MSDEVKKTGLEALSSEGSTEFEVKPWTKEDLLKAIDKAKKASRWERPRPLVLTEHLYRLLIEQDLKEVSDA